MKKWKLEQILKWSFVQVLCTSNKLFTYPCYLGSCLLLPIWESSFRILHPCLALALARVLQVVMNDIIEGFEGLQEDSGEVLHQWILLWRGCLSKMVRAHPSCTFLCDIQQHKVQRLQVFVVVHLFLKLGYFARTLRGVFADSASSFLIFRLLPFECFLLFPFRSWPFLELLSPLSSSKLLDSEDETSFCLLHDIYAFSSTFRAFTSRRLLSAT